MTKLSWIGVAVLWAGCNNGGVGGGSTATIDDYESTSAHVICQLYSHCGEISPSEESTCETGYRALIGGSGYLIKDAIAAGRISYNAGAAQSCLNLFSSIGCNFNTAGLDVNVCRSIITPKVQPGGMCLEDEECINGFCTHPTGGNGCPGTCTPYIVSGANCSSNISGCAPTQWCNTTSGNVCTDLGKQGDACSFGSCQSNLNCLDDGTGNTTCQPLPTKGQHCSDACAPGLRCDIPSMTCMAQQQKGGACSYSMDCAPGLSCAIPAQATTGTCEPFVDIGKSCGSTAVCAGDAMCDPTSNTCVGKSGLGADCTTDSCGLFLTCDSTTMKCVTLGAVGNSCTTNDVCETSYCDPTSSKCAIDCS
jgi:hypothetical protein